jgi:folate-binding protein YgfZ
MPHSKNQTIGVIGLGIIGRGISANLRSKGFQVFVWNRTPRPVPNFVGSPAELAEICDCIQIFVSDDEALLHTVHRLSKHLAPRHIVIGHPTVAPDSMRAAAEVVDGRGARFVEAPFTGSKVAAEKGELVYYTGGDSDVLRQARPILEASSKQIVEIGGLGHATVIKIATNMVTAASVQATAEALALVQALGVPLEKFVQAMQANASHSTTLAMKMPKMINRDFEPHFSIKHMLKDMQIANQLGLSHYLDLGVTPAARDQLLEQMQWGGSDDDFSAVARKYLAETESGSYDDPELPKQEQQASARENAPALEAAPVSAQISSGSSDAAAIVGSAGSGQVNDGEPVASEISHAVIAPRATTLGTTRVTQRGMTPPLQIKQDRFLDLSGRTRLHVTGRDRLRFLNGQITNDVRKAGEAVAVEACVLNAKGKMNGHIFVSAGPESFWIDADPRLRESLPTRLERYVIADDVQIEDVTDRWSIFHVLSQTAPGLSECRIVSLRRFAEPGWDIWTDTAKHDDILERLVSTFHLIDASAAEGMRIEQGIPRWGCELTDEIIPIEANLEERTIDYEKGCYIGQEVISRIKMSGQTNKRLCGLISLDDIPLQAGMRLASTGEKGKEAGWITSATRSDKVGREIALGYVKRGFNSAGVKLTAAPKAFAGSGLDALGPENSGTVASIPVQVVLLPFSDVSKHSLYPAG